MKLNHKENGGGGNTDALTKMFITAYIRQHIRRLDAIANGEDIRGEFGGCRATRYNRRRRMAKSIGSTPVRKGDN